MSGGRVEAPSLKDSLKSPQWWIPIVLFVLFAVGVIIYKHHRNSFSRGFEFRGTVLGHSAGTMGKAMEDSGRRSFGRRAGRRAAARGITGLFLAVFGDPVSATLYVETDKGELVEWPVAERSSEYFNPGDYVIKEKGEKPAVYRNGKQVTYSVHYREDPVEFTPPERPREIEEAAVAAVAPTPTPAPTPLPVSEQSVAMLMEQARVEWQAGRIGESCIRCEEALKMRKQMYPANDPRVAELEKRLEFARQALAKERMAQPGANP